MGNKSTETICFIQLPVQSYIDGYYMCIFVFITVIRKS